MTPTIMPISTEVIIETSGMAYRFFLYQLRLINKINNLNQNIVDTEMEKVLERVHLCIDV